MTPEERRDKIVENAAKMRRWRQKHKEKAAALDDGSSLRSKRWRERHPNKSMLYDRQRRMTISGRANTLFSGARSRAKQFGRRFTLTRAWVEEHLAPMRCEATGAPLSFEAYHPLAPSIDRKCNEGSYTPENCWVVARRFNFCKRNKTAEEALETYRHVVLASA